MHQDPKEIELDSLSALFILLFIFTTSHFVAKRGVRTGLTYRTWFLLMVFQLPRSPLFWLSTSLFSGERSTPFTLDKVDLGSEFVRGLRRFTISQRPKYA